MRNLLSEYRMQNWLSIEFGISNLEFEYQILLSIKSSDVVAAAEHGVNFVECRIRKLLSIKLCALNFVEYRIKCCRS